MNEMIKIITNKEKTSHREVYDVYKRYDNSGVDRRDVIRSICGSYQGIGNISNEHICGRSGRGHFCNPDDTCAKSSDVDTEMDSLIESEKE